MSDLILKLALQAMTDEDALPVVADAIIHARWYDPRLAPLILGPYGVSPYFEDWSVGTTKWWLDMIPGIGTEGACAVAAVLLFGDWPTMWPLAQSCYEAGPWYRSYRVIESRSPIQILPDAAVPEGHAFLVSPGDVLHIRDIGDERPTPRSE